MISPLLMTGVTMDQIADELRQAYKANKEILDHFKEDYAKKENPLFQDFVEELLFVKRNVAGVIPADQEQFNRLLDRLFQLVRDSSNNEFALQAAV